MKIQLDLLILLLCGVIIFSCHLQSGSASSPYGAYGSYSSGRSVGSG